MDVRDVQCGFGRRAADGEGLEERRWKNRRDLGGPMVSFWWRAVQGLVQSLDVVTDRESRKGGGKPGKKEEMGVDGGIDTKKCEEALCRRLRIDVVWAKRIVLCGVLDVSSRRRGSRDSSRLVSGFSQASIIEDKGVSTGQVWQPQLGDHV